MGTTTCGSLALHIMDVGGRLDDFAEEMRRAFAPAVAAVSQHLALDEIDIAVYASDSVIPEIGMNAFAEHGNLIRFWLDPKHPALQKNFDITFTALLAHELHHVIRERGPGYGRTLRDSLVSEGLACQFEREVVGQLPPYGMEVLADEVTARFARIAPQLDGPFSPAWMFGSHEQGIERSFGYRLGSTLVSQWLRAHTITAAEAVHIETSVIAEHWG